MTERPSAGVAEATPLSEHKIVKGAAQSRLGSLTNAVFDGSHLKLGFVDKNSDGTEASLDQSKDFANKLAERLKKYLGHDINGDQILQISQQLNQLENTIYLNVLGGEQMGLASSLVTVAFLDYIVQHPDLPHDRLMLEAHMQAKRVLDDYVKDNPPIQRLDHKVALAAAIVNKNGEVTTINTGGNDIGLLDQQGHKKGEVITGKEDSKTHTPQIQKAMLAAGDRIVLCGEGGFDSLVTRMQQENTVYNLSQMVDFLSAPSEGKEILGTKSGASSSRGGRPDEPDEDSVYTSSHGFNLGEIGGDDKKTASLDERTEGLANVLNGLEVKDAKGKSETIQITKEDINKTHQTIQELIRQGKLGGLEIVCDGTGSHGAGEIASSIGTYIFTKEIAKLIQARDGVITEDDLRSAVIKANDTIVSYNGKKLLNAGTTLLASVTDKDGKAFVVSLGDSRAYKKDQTGNIIRLTKDQSLVESLVELGRDRGIKPSEVFTHPSRNIILTGLGGGVLTPEKVQIYQEELLEGEQLILCCDGVWEGIDRNNAEVQSTLKNIDNKFEDAIKSGVPIHVAANRAFGEIFKVINLAGLPANATQDQIVAYLTRDEVGKNSEDNVSAVVIQNVRQKEKIPGKSSAAAEVGEETTPQAAKKKDEIMPKSLEEAAKGIPPAPTQDEPERPEVTPPDRFEFGLVSGKQRVADMERLEELSREVARLFMTEERNEWSKKTFTREGLKVIVKRYWKYTFGETATYSKEKAHALKLLIESGVNLTTLPYDFLKQVDELARHNVEERRKGFGSKLGGRLSDLGNEIFYREKELHGERLSVIRELRSFIDKPDAAAEKHFLDQHPEYANVFKLYQDVLSGEFQASEALADTIISKHKDALILRQAAGEKRSAQAIKVEGPIRDFIADEALSPLARNLLTSPTGQVDQRLLLQVKEKVKNYFRSSEFAKWYFQQPQEVQDSLKLTLSFANNIDKVFLESFAPQLLQQKAHLQGTVAIEEYTTNYILGLKEKMYMRVGTLEAGQKGVLGEGWMEKHVARGVTEERVLNFYRKLNQQSNAPRLSTENIDRVSEARLEAINYLTSVPTWGIVFGLGAVTAETIARTTIRAGGTIAIPVAGGALAAGIYSAGQARRYFTREYEQHEIEKALGYEFPKDARRRAEMQALERNKRSMKDQMTNMAKVLQQMEAGTANEQQLMGLFGALADTRARLQIMDIRGIDLFAGQNPQSYRSEFELLKKRYYAGGIEALQKHLGTHSDVLDSIEKQLGIQNPPADVDSRVDHVINQLAANQAEHLEKGANIDANYAKAIGALKLDDPLTQTIEARERAFGAKRNQKTIGAFLVTSGAALLAPIGSGAINAGFQASAEWAANNACNVDLPVLREAVGLFIHKEPPVFGSPVKIEDTQLSFNLPKGITLDHVDPKDKIAFFKQDGNPTAIELYWGTDPATGAERITNVIHAPAGLDLSGPTQPGVDIKLDHFGPEKALPGTNIEKFWNGDLEVKLPPNFTSKSTTNGIDIIDGTNKVHHFIFGKDAAGKTILKAVNPNEQLVPHLSEKTATVLVPQAPLPGRVGELQLDQVLKDPSIERLYPKIKYLTNFSEVLKGKAVSDYQELEFHNSLFRHTDTGNFGVVLDAGRMTKTIDYLNPDGTPHFANVKDLVANSKYGMQFAFRLGDHKGIFLVDANQGPYKFVLDPDNTRPLISNGSPVILQEDLKLNGKVLFPKGYHMKVGDFAKVILNPDKIKENVDDLKIPVGTSADTAVPYETEYLNNFNKDSEAAEAFRLRLNGKNGTIGSVFTGKDGTVNYLAAITGAEEAKMPITIPPEPLSPIPKPKTITEIAWGIKEGVYKQIPKNQYDISTCVPNEFNIPIIPFPPLFGPRQPLEASEGVTGPTPTFERPKPPKPPREPKTPPPAPIPPTRIPEEGELEGEPPVQPEPPPAPVIPPTTTEEEEPVPEEERPERDERSFTGKEIEEGERPEADKRRVSEEEITEGEPPPTDRRRFSGDEITEGESSPADQRSFTEEEIEEGERRTKEKVTVEQGALTEARSEVTEKMAVRTKLSPEESKRIREKRKQLRGLLKKEGWEDTKERRDELENARRQTKKLAEDGLKELEGYDLTLEQIASLRPDEIHAAARKFKPDWKDDTPTNDFVRNIQISAREKLQTPVKDLALKALGELRENARKKGNNEFGWSNIRATSLEKLLTNMIKEAGWLDLRATREYLRNAKRYADHIAEQAINELKGFNLTEDQIATLSVVEIHAEVKKHNPNWQADPATDDYVRTAQSLLQERHVTIDVKKAQETMNTLREIAERQGIKDFGRESLQLVETDELFATITEPAPEKKEIPRAESIRYLKAEAETGDTTTLYLDEKTRNEYQVNLGDTMVVKLGDGEIAVKVAEPLTHPFTGLDNADAPYIRATLDVFSTLDIPRVYGVVPVFNKDTKELTLNSPEDEKSSVIKFRKPRRITAETVKTNEEAIYLTPEELQAFGLAAGDEINIRLESMSRKVKVALSEAPKPQGDKKPRQEWRLSQKLFAELHVSTEIELRASFDKNAKELDIGPLIAFTTSINKSDWHLDPKAAHYQETVEYIENGQEATKDLNFPEKSEKERSAQEAVDKLMSYAQSEGITLDYAAIREADIEEWFKDDGQKGEMKGILKRQGWSNPQEDRKYLKRAQRYLVHLAEKGIGEFAPQQLTAKDIAEKSWDDLVALASDMGWHVNDPKQTSYESTTRYLKNLQAWAKRISTPKDQIEVAAQEAKNKLVEAAKTKGQTPFTWSMIRRASTQELLEFMQQNSDWQPTSESIEYLDNLKLFVDILADEARNKLTQRGFDDEKLRDLPIDNLIEILKKVTINNYSWFSGFDQHARDHGGVAIAIDPDKQNPDLLNQGLAEGYILLRKDGKEKIVSVIVPLPDFAYDKVKSPWNLKFKHRYISGKQRAITSDKLKDAQIMAGSKLSEYQPATMLFYSDKPQAFFEFLDRYHEVVLKPRKGFGGRGVMRVTKEGDNFVLKYPHDGELKELKFGSGEELYAQVIEQANNLASQSKLNPEYIIQEKINIPLATIREPDGSIKEGYPEFRLTFMRGIDGKPQVTVMIARMMSKNFIGSPDIRDARTMIAQIYGERAKEIIEKLEEIGREKFKIMNQAVKEDNLDIGEITFDYGITAEGKPMFIEDNSVAQIGGTYAQDVAPIEYALYKKSLN